MAEEIKETEVVEEVEQEEVDTQETTEQQQEEVVSKQTMKDRLDRKEKQHQKEVGSLKDTISSIQQELEEIRTAQMPEEEQVSYRQQKEEEERERRLQELTDREKELELRENTLKVQSQLSEKEINPEFVHILLDTGKYKSLEDKVEAFSDIMTANNEAVKGASQKELLSGREPKAHVNANQIVTQEQFNKMGYSERVALKQKDENLYNKLKGE